MASKFVVQYIIKAKDAFSRNVGKASDSINKFAKNTEKADRATKKFNRNSSKFGGVFDSIKSKIPSATDTLKKFGAIATGVFASVIAVGSKFQTAMADMSSITGASGKELQFYTDESMRLGKAAIFAQDKVATAFKLVASAKSDLLKDPKALSNVTEQVLLLANASGMDLTTSANVVTQSLNQYGASAKEASRFVNVLAAGSKIGASEVNETGVAISKAATVAKTMAKISFEELNASIQVLAKNGQKAELAGTGLKTMLLRLETQNNNKIKPSVVGLTTALENLKGMNMTTKQQTKLFGAEAINIGGILMNNAGLVKQWTGELTGTNIANEQAAINTATFAKKMEKLWIVIKEKLIKVFLQLEPMLSKAGEQFSAWLDSVDDEQLTKFSDSLAVIFNGLVSIMGIAGDVMNFFGFVGDSVGRFAGALMSGEGAEGLRKSRPSNVAKKLEQSSKENKLSASSLTNGGFKADANIQVSLDKGLKENESARSIEVSRYGNVGMNAL